MPSQRSTFGGAARYLQALDANAKDLFYSTLILQGGIVLLLVAVRLGLRGYARRKLKRRRQRIDLDFREKKFLNYARWQEVVAGARWQWAKDLVLADLAQRKADRALAFPKLELPLMLMFFEAAIQTV